MGADPLGGGHFAGVGYHAAMVGDPHRLVAFERALRRAVFPGARVLDVGTGTGVLALLAARLGAGHVVAVESTPVARLARRVVEANGLTDRITVVEADMRTLTVPVADADKVDVIVSDCLGRFVVDDFMGEAMAAAMRWLKPGGCVIPNRVELVVAPVAVGHIAVLDLWLEPVFGLDLAPIGRAATERPLGATLGADAVLGTPAVIGVWSPGQVTPTFATEMISFTTSAAGRLRAFAGWFEADLGNGVRLATAPGIETHWHQLLFPVAPRWLEVGVRLELLLELQGISSEPVWGWKLSIGGDDASEETYGGDDGSFVVPSDTISRLPDDLTSEAASEAGAEAFAAGDAEAALRHFENALQRHFGERAMLAEPDVVLQRLLEDVGTASVIAGHDRRALLPLLAVATEALTREAPLTPRQDPHLEQALRLLVDVCFRLGRHHDGGRFLIQYEALFGLHPSGWVSSRPQAR